MFDVKVSMQKNRCPERWSTDGWTHDAITSPYWLTGSRASKKNISKQLILPNVCVL